jgi:hypothetical protein
MCQLRSGMKQLMVDVGWICGGDERKTIHSTSHEEKTEKNENFYLQFLVYL